jgi:hypothetical protein
VRAVSRSLTLVVLVACALVASAGRTGDRVAASGDDGPGLRTGVGTAVAALCLLAAGLVLAYGIHLIVG